MEGKGRGRGRGGGEGEEGEEGKGRGRGGEGERKGRRGKGRGGGGKEVDGKRRGRGREGKGRRGKGRRGKGRRGARKRQSRKYTCECCSCSSEYATSFSCRRSLVCCKDAFTEPTDASKLQGMYKSGLKIDNPLPSDLHKVIKDNPEEVRHASRNADSACPFCIGAMAKRAR